MTLARVLTAAQVGVDGHALRGQKCEITSGSVFDNTKDAVLYNDVDGLAQVPNPTVTNAVGQVECVVAEGTYTARISYTNDAGNPAHVDVTFHASVVGQGGAAASLAGDVTGTTDADTVAKVGGRAVVTEVVWTAVPTLQNSWANKAGFQAAQYSVDNRGVCRLRGTIDTGTKTAGTLITTLPVGARPVTKQAFSVIAEVAATSNNAGEVIVDTDGTVKVGETALTASSYISLDGIEFDTTA